MRRRRWWIAWIARRLRKIRDSCHGSAIQLWDRLTLNWLVVGWVILLLIFFIVIERKLASIPPRKQQMEQQIKDLELIDSQSRCPKR